MHTQAERQGKAAHAHVAPGYHVEPVQHPLEEPQHDQPNADPQPQAERRGGQVVGEPFDGERGDQVTALCPDRAHHAHLRAALGGEHDEDQEHEQQTGGAGEQPQDQEDRNHRRAILIGGVDRPLLDL
jgi:hypothetical protein